MPTMTIIDRHASMILIVAYGDARENGRGAADAYGEIERVLDNHGYEVLFMGAAHLVAHLNE